MLRQLAPGLGQDAGGDRASGVVPGFLMGDDPAQVRAGLRKSLDRLLELDFDNPPFAHGEPLIGGGKVERASSSSADDLALAPFMSFATPSR